MPRRVKRAAPTTATVRRALRATTSQRQKTAPDITAREAEIIGLVARGHTTREIAAVLAISDRAVTAHVTRLMAKFRVPNRSGLIAAVMAAAGFGLPISRRPPLTRVGAQAHLAGLDEGEQRQYLDAPFLVAVTRGPDHIFTFVNRVWERVMGLRGADVIGRRVRDVFPSAPIDSYRARQRAYRSGWSSSGKSWRFKWITHEGAARESDFNYIYQPLRTMNGKIEGLLLIATEATD